MVRKLRTLMNGVFISLVFICPSLSLAETVQISTVNDLKSFATRVNSGETSLDAVLTTNITLNDSWTPIGNGTNKYAGKFDGCGFSIFGLSVSASSKGAGLFGYTLSCQIKNLNVADAQIKSSDNYIGGICGSLVDGVITNCSFSGTISSSGSKIVQGIGGICGYMSNGTITACSFSGTLTTPKGIGVGGICGQQLNKSIITSCLNFGAISGVNKVGGISGNGVTINNCVNIGSVVASSEVGAICGSFCTASNNYFLIGSQNTGILDVSDVNAVRSVSKLQLSSGEIAYLLGHVDSVWGQRLTVDETPQLQAPRVIKVSVDAESNGSVDGPNGYCNAPVTVSAIPNDGYVFDSWNNGDTTQQLVLVQDVDLEASFVEGVGVTLYNGNDEGMDILWNPNRIFSPQGNQLLFVETDAIRGNNVIVDGTCTTVLLKDGAPFYTPSAFKTKNLVYDRSLSPGSVSSFVLPFSVDVDKIGGDVYKFIKADDSTFYFKMVEDATEANVPYLVSVPGDASGALLPDGCVDAVIEGGAPVGVRASQITHFGDYQTHKYTSSVATSYLGLSKGKLLKAKEGVSVTNNPFRTAFSMENIKMLALSAFALNFDGEVGGVALLDSEDPFTALVDVYDVNGRMVRANVMAATCLQSLPNGIYIVGGRKFAVRNGQSSGCSRLKSANPDIVSE